MNHAALLSAIQAGGVNGAILAERLGVSRTAVWKAIQQLRAEGLQIEGAAGEGYRLMGDAGFGPHTLSWKLGRDAHFFSQCDSTNVEARRLATEQQAQKTTIVVADSQRAGRGRLGRQWNAEAGWVDSFASDDSPGIWNNWILGSGLYTKLQYQF